MQKNSIGGLSFTAAVTSPHATQSSECQARSHWPSPHKPEMIPYAHFIWVRLSYRGMQARYENIRYGKRMQHMQMALNGGGEFLFERERLPQDAKVKAMCSIAIIAHAFPLGSIR